MKRIVIVGIILTVASMVFLFADVEATTIPSVSFTAYKSNTDSNGMPADSYSLALSQPNGNAIVESSTPTLITLGESSRNTTQKFFLWSVNGTHAGDVSVTFTFSPLSLVLEGSVRASIPYDITMVHETSNVDGVPVAVNRSTASLSPRKCSFSTYLFNYSDTVKMNTDSGSYSNATTKTVSVTSSSVSVGIKWNLASATVTKNASGENQSISYPYTVTDHWVRTGYCEIKPKITSDGKYTDNGSTAFPAGWYTATVTVGITAQ